VRKRDPSLGQNCLCCSTSLSTSHETCTSTFRSSVELVNWALGQAIASLHQWRVKWLVQLMTNTRAAYYSGNDKRTNSALSQRHRPAR